MPFLRRIYKIQRFKGGVNRLSCGAWIPKDWHYVIIELLEYNKDYVIVRIRRADDLVKGEL